MFSTIKTAAICGMETVTVRVEVDIAHGLPGLMLVGYLGSEVKEAGERVRVALKNSGISLPPMRITVNLSPANIRKGGTAFDLPIAVGILESLGHIPEGSIGGIMIAGELGLNGTVSSVRGILPFVRKAKEEGIARCMVPAANREEGSGIDGVEVIGVSDLKQAIEYFKTGKKYIDKSVDKTVRETDSEEPDFCEINGQTSAKRAAEIAAAGFHNLLLTGPPGSGKTMIAKRVPGILPPLTTAESLEVSSIYSISGLLTNNKSFITHRPFMNPHHTITAQALAGGGNLVKPGIISLAHKGVLFFDELPEYKTNVIDMLRQPLEEKQIQIARLGGNYNFPAEFMFIAAMNPCPCGYYPDVGKCRCTAQAIRRYQRRISGPVLDRIDICAGVNAVTMQELVHPEKEESSEDIKKRVMQARKIQEERYKGKGYYFNALLPQEEIKKSCHLGEKEMRFMERAFGMIQMSARAYYRILKVARTIADLDGMERVEEAHLAEAVECRFAADKYLEQ